MSAPTKRGSTLSPAASMPASNTGEFIQDDMVAVRVSPDHRPRSRRTGVFADHPPPTSPHDLLEHRCINYRHGWEKVYTLGTRQR